MVFRRVPLLFIVLVALLIASCGSDAISFEGERAADAANTPANVEPVTAQPTVEEAPTAEPIESAATAETDETDETVEEPTPAPNGGDDAAAQREQDVEVQLQMLETVGGMTWVGGERECVGTTLLATDALDPTVDTQVLNCLDDDGVHRWVSAQLAVRGGSERSIIDPTESLCVWEQSDGQILTIDTPSSPAIQRCGVWGRVNLGGLQPLSDETLACLDVQMQTTRLPDGTDRVALDERFGQCASPDELTFWNTL